MNSEPEKVYTISQLKDAKGLSLHHMTIVRWHTRGIKRGKQTIKLAANRIGGRLHITEAAYEKFLDDLNPERAAERKRDERRQERNRQRRQANADVVLKYFKVLPGKEAG